MFLVTDNNQGELSPLEIGLHALEYVEKDKRGMGANGGGLKGYAESVGKPQSRISEYRQAADVFRSINSNVGINEDGVKSRLELMDKANHLVAIHKAPSSLWPILVSSLLAKEWSVKDIPIRHVPKIRAKKPRFTSGAGKAFCCQIRASACQRSRCSLRSAFCERSTSKSSCAALSLSVNP